MYEPWIVPSIGRVLFWIELDRREIPWCIVGFRPSRWSTFLFLGMSGFFWLCLTRIPCLISLSLARSLSICISSLVRINTRLTAGIRCTVQIDSYTTSHVTGTVVSPSAPRLDNGTYWGYTTRLASSLTAALEESPYNTGYDFKIGTSERGSHNLEAKSYQVPPSFQHALLVLGGVAGLEECVNADESIAWTGNQCSKLFDHWVNICPYQGSRTIRTEEAVWIALAKYSPLLAKANEVKSQQKVVAVVAPAEFSDEPSDESSEEDEKDDEGSE